MTRRPTDVRRRKSAPSPSRVRGRRAAPPPTEVTTAAEAPLLAATVVHHTNARLRVKFPTKKGNEAFFASVAEKFAKCPGVEKVEVNPTTASVLFVHSITPKQIDRFAVRNGLFRLASWRHARKTLFGDVASTFENWNRNLKQSTGGGVDIPSLIFLSLIVSGIYQVMRGNITMPAWYTAFYYALGIFSKGHVEEPDEGPEMLRGDDEGGEIPDDLGDDGGGD